jgi:hypothetical protein
MRGGYKNKQKEPAINFETIFNAKRYSAWNLSKWKHLRLETGCQKFTFDYRFVRLILFLKCNINSNKQ